MEGGGGGGGCCGLSTEGFLKREIFTLRFSSRPVNQ